MARVTLADLRRSRPHVDRAMLESTTEAQIRKQAIEDGEDPDIETGPALHVVPAGEVRRRLDLSQADFARAIHVPLKTVQNWEQGRTLPDPAARSLLTIVALAPVAALRALNPGSDDHWNTLVEKARQKRDREASLESA